MLLKALNTREASRVGTALADGLPLPSESARGGDKAVRRRGAPTNGHGVEKFLQSFLKRVDQEVHALRVNILNRAIIANSFKWRLREKGVERHIADELTHALVTRLSTGPSGSVAPETSTTAARRDAVRRESLSKLALLAAQADESLARGAYSDAARDYQALLELDPDNVTARNNLGMALYEQGFYRQAEEELRRAIVIKPSLAEAQCNLGTVLRGRGFLSQSETALRRAIKLQPAKVEFQVSLAATLIPLGRVHEARERLEKVLRLAPQNVEALVTMGDVAGSEGRMGEAENFYKRALDVAPKTARAWAGLVRLRKMTSADREWLKNAQATAASGLAPKDETTIHYALGKYYDDIRDFERAFRSYKHANELQRRTVGAYDREQHKRLVDDLIRAYGADTLTALHKGASDSQRPVFVVGMMRSGTSLVAQIIASHPAAVGAGELPFWPEAMRKHEADIRHKVLAEPLRRKLAATYLRVLEKHSPDALRVVDKANFNSDYLGPIHTVLPRARIIYLRRDPVDTCLSCYFQQLSSAFPFALDLPDLAHYYREHQRLVAHWKRVLPKGTLLEVPYAELVANQEPWTRRILDFLGLEWDARCLDFHKTERVVLTSSYWQVRQKIYKSSLGRWHNYRKFVGPLLELRELDPLSR